MDFSYSPSIDSTLDSVYVSADEYLFGFLNEIFNIVFWIMLAGSMLVGEAMPQANIQ